MAPLPKRVILIGGMICAALFCCNARPGTQKQPLPKLTADNDGEQVTIIKGHSFLLILNDNVMAATILTTWFMTEPC